jgi:hypothetical protein
MAFTVREDIVDLEKMVAQATTDLEAAEAQLHAAQQRVEELRTIRDGLRLGMERYGSAELGSADVHGTATYGVTGASSTVTAGSTRVTVTSARRRRPAKRRPAARRPNPEVSQTELCITALKDFAKPASTTEIRERLNEGGHQYDAEQIRSALAYLLRRERVVRLGSGVPGVWTLPPAPNGSAASANGHPHA